MEAGFSVEDASAFATKGEDSLEGHHITTSTVGFSDTYTDEAVRLRNLLHALPDPNDAAPRPLPIARARNADLFDLLLQSAPCNRQALSFYTQEHERHQRGTSLSGVVPLVYTTAPFHLHISGVNWAAATMLRPPRLQASLLLERFDPYGEVVHTCTHETELVVGESSPSFTKALELPPQTEPNSQAIAQHTLLTVTPRSRGRELRKVRFVLAALLWNGAATALLPNSASVRIDVRAGVPVRDEPGNGDAVAEPADTAKRPELAEQQGSRDVAAEPADIVERSEPAEMDQPVASASVQTHPLLNVPKQHRGEVSVTATLPRALRRGGTRIAVSATGARGGGWARLVATDAKRGAAAVQACVRRDALPGGKMRVDFFGRRAGVLRRVGFALLRIGQGQQQSKRDIEWRACRGAGSVSVAGARVGGWTVRGNDIEVDLVLGESADDVRAKAGDAGSAVQFPEAEITG